MNTNRLFLRKYATMLAFAVSIILFLPEAAVGKGAVIGYACGDQIEQTLDTTILAGYPTNEQLNRLTHVMAVDLYPDANGYLHTTILPES